MATGPATALKTPSSRRISARRDQKDASPALPLLAFGGVPAKAAEMGDIDRRNRVVGCDHEPGAPGQAAKRGLHQDDRHRTAIAADVEEGGS
jgi:hypothetical protein